MMAQFLIGLEIAGSWQLKHSGLQWEWLEDGLGSTKKPLISISTKEDTQLSSQNTFGRTKEKEQSYLSLHP